MIPIIIATSVICIILMYVIIVYSQVKANNDNPVYHREENGILHVMVFVTSKTGGNYSEYLFERNYNGYALTQEDKEKRMHGLKIGLIYCFCIAIVVTIAAAVNGANNIMFAFLFGLFVGAMIIGIIGLFEFYHYKLAKNYLEKNRP